MKVYTVHSETSPKKKYKVYDFENGEFACKCPSHAFGKEGFECKHIKRLKKYLKRKK